MNRISGTEMSDYFQNDWQAVHDTPASRFRRAPFIDVMRRATSWDDGLEGAVMRLEDPETGKVTEKRYKRVTSLDRTVRNHEKKNLIVTVYTADQMYCTVGVGDDELDEDEE